MGFIFGLLVGGALVSGGGQTPSIQSLLNSIPLRCFAALDLGDTAYADCRRSSMARELAQQSAFSQTDTGVCYYIWRGRADQVYHKPIIDLTKSSCDVEAAIALEIKALRQLEASAKAQQR